VRLMWQSAGLCALAFGLIAPAPRAMAQANAPHKVAIINIQGAILATKDGDKARADIRAKFEGRAKELESRAAEINKLRASFSSGANTMSQEQRDKLSRDIDDKSKKYQWDSEDLQNDVQQEEQKFVNDIGQRMMEIVGSYAKENGYTLVLDVSSQQSPVLWASESTNITQDIVALYDKKFAGGAAPAAAKPPATPPPAAPKKPGAVK